MKFTLDDVTDGVASQQKTPLEVFPAMTLPAPADYPADDIGGRAVNHNATVGVAEGIGPSDIDCHIVFLDFVPAASEPK